MPAKPKTRHLANVIQRNINTLLEVRHQIEKGRNIQDKIADVITAFSGSTSFLFIHVVWFVVWMMINTGHLGIAVFDPFPYGLLTMIVSLEAIFLSTFVLISQNRMAIIADQRADLDLQINLLAEYEITRILKLVDAMADKMGIEESKNKELEELKKDIYPDVILREMEKLKNKKGMPCASHGEIPAVGTKDRK